MHLLRPIFPSLVFGDGAKKEEEDRGRKCRDFSGCIGGLSQTFPSLRDGAKKISLFSQFGTSSFLLQDTIENVQIKMQHSGSLQRNSTQLTQHKILNRQTTHFLEYRSCLRKVDLFRSRRHNSAFTSQLLPPRPTRPVLLSIRLFLVLSGSDEVINISLF